MALKSERHEFNGYQTSNLEPRVAKLETGLEILTRDVTSLANVVREQSRNIETEIQKLAVAVTQASAPRKTEWPTLIATIMLIMAIGSAVFWPLNQTSANNKAEIHEVRDSIVNHLAQDSHPVTGEILKQMNVRLNKLEANEDQRNKDEIGELREIKRTIIKYHMGPIPNGESVK